MANLKSWEEASKSPAYTGASPERQAQMREQFKAAGGVIPEATQAPKQEEPTGFLGNIAQGVSNAIESGGANIAHGAARGIGGLVEMGENLTGTQTGYGKRIQENAKQVLDKRMAGIEDGYGKTAGEYAGIVGDIGLTVANPLAAAVLIAARETGRAYADQQPEEGEDKSAFNAALVGGANYAAQRILPGMTGTAPTTLGRVAQSVGANAVAGAKGGAVVGAAEALNKHGDDTTLAHILEGTAEGAGTGALYGGAIGGVTGLVSRPSPQVFDKTPSHVKTDIEAEGELIRNATNADELRGAYSNASNSNTATALNLLDENGFRLTDAVALDSPTAQRILNTDQSRAEKAATVLERRSNIPGVNPLATPNRRQGKANADNEHNQKQAVAMKGAMADQTKDNVNKLSSVLDDLDRELTSARASGDFAGTATDVKNRTQADRDFIDAYKTFYNEANTFKNRSGEDFDNFVEKATELQKLSDNVSPEMKSAIGDLKKLKGMPEGFNPIQDAHALNETAKLMSNQDRGWTTLTSKGFDEASAPELMHKPLGAARFALNRFFSSRARTQRENQQNQNREAIQSLAKDDLNMARTRRNAEEARNRMEESPPEDDINFKTQDETPIPKTEEIQVPESQEVRSPMRPDPVESPMQKMQRQRAEQQAAAEAAMAEADVSPAPRGLSADELAGAQRSMEALRQRRAAEEPKPEVVEEPPAATVTEEITPPQQSATTARELVEQSRLRKAADRRRSAREAEAQAAHNAEAERAKPTPEPETSPAVTARELLAQRRAVKTENERLEAERQRLEAERTPEPEPEPVVEPTVEPEPSVPAVTSRELIAQRKAAKAENERMRAEKEQAEAEKAPEPTPEPVQEKSEPLPATAPKVAEKAPEPVKPESGIEKLASMSTTARQIAKDRAERFARSLYTPAAKAKATAENFAAYKGDFKALMRSIRQEDQANNTARHEEMARNQLASQRGIAAAKSERVRKDFADWVTERGLPSEYATKALRAEEKGLNGVVTSLDSLKRRAERLYQKDREAEFDRLYQEALQENKTFDKKDAPKLADQKGEMISEIDKLLKEEPLHPSQKAAIKELMTDLVNSKFKSAEKAGREEALETGQLKDVWETFTNTFNKEAGMFNKANKNTQYEATAQHLQAREDRLKTLQNKAAARAEAKAQIERDRQTLEAIAGQKTEIENLMKGLPDEVRKAQESRTLKQLAAHHDKDSPVPPEKFRSYIERIHNAESDFLDRTRRLSEAEEDARTAKWNRMYEQAEELNRRFDIDSRVKRDAELKAAQERENDLMAVQRQRDDIHSRLSRSLEEKGIPREDAEVFAGSYMDNRYTLLEKPMTATEYQNARSRIESDVDRFAKKFDKLTPIEREIAKATGDSEIKANLQDSDLTKAIDDAKKIDDEVKKLQEEEMMMEKVRSALPEDERAQANSDIKEAIKKQEDDFADKIETAFSSNKDLGELASIAEILDRVHGADKAGNNRRFIRALQTAAENKKRYGDNPVAWFSSGDYSEIAKLGASSAGGNKTRALEKIFDSTADQAKGKLLGKGDVEKIRRVIEGNPDIKLPPYKTSVRSDYMAFLDKFNNDGTPKIKRGSLADKMDRQKRQRQVKLRVKSKE